METQMEMDKQPELIADYLTRHPNFFNDFPALLADIHVPHPHGTHAISMGERQLLSMRDKVRLLENKLAELLQFGEENDGISEKLHDLTLSLLAARRPVEVVAALNAHLREGFAVPHYALRVWHLPDPRPNPLMQPLAIPLGRQETPAKSLLIPQGNSDFVRAEAHVKSYVPHAGEGANAVPKATSDSGLDISQAVSATGRDAIAALKQPVCGALAVSEASEWFGEAAAHLRSFASIPLNRNGNIGLLVLASEEPNRFYASMGTLYLERLGQILAATLQRMQA